LKFRRQHPLGAYIVDFVCLEAHLIIEVDGGQHIDQAAKDAARTLELNRLGFCVLRFWDNEVLTQTQTVLEAIHHALSEKLPSPRPSGCKAQMAITPLIQGILLASGSATRFGSDKLMHPMKDGEAMAVHSARHLLEALPGAIAVVRSAASPLAGKLKAEGLRIVECADAAEGMGRTLAAGVAASREAGGWVIALADMPFLQPATIKAVADRVRAGDAIVAPMYRGERGHPVGFAARFRGELETFRGDEGARTLLRSQKEQIHLLEVQDAGVVRDVDTPGDLERAQ
jgi:molybdenum cofactor cytidylyltransferase